jgi:iron complex transport system substrate-binding protein
VRVASRPDRIVSLSPTTTEMLFAIGAGHQVVAVDNDSNYPAGVPRTTLSGYTPNVEAIAGYRPDLVVISYNPNPPNLVHALGVLHIPVLYLPASANLAQTYAQLVELGKVTGTRAGAGRVVAGMRTEVARLVAEVHRHRPPLTYFFELDPTLYTATGDTFIGSVLALAGLRDITGPSVHGSDYPQLSAEAVLRANPTFIFLADGASVPSVARRPGWSALQAVRDHRATPLDPDVASRWGPRIVDLLAKVVRVADGVPAKKAA